MLIWLDPSILDAATSSDVRARALDNLLVAHLQGRHLVGLEPETYRAIKASPILADLSRGARETLEMIGHRHAELGAVRRAMSVSLRVGAGPGFASITADGREILVGIDHFEPHERVGRTNLLAENFTDTDLFALIGRAFLESGRQSGLVRLAFEAHSGGGQETHRTFQRLIEGGLATLAIMDGDLRYPGGSLGQTARDAQRRPRTLLQHLEVLPVREAENLLPIEVYEAALPQNHFPPARRDALRAFAARAPSGHPFYRHMDLKKGLRLHRLFFKMNADERAHWAPLERGERCSQATPCTREDKEEKCSCYLVEGLGDKALAAVVTHLKERDAVDLPALFGAALVQGLGALIAAWGAAAKPARAFARER